MLILDIVLYSFVILLIVYIFRKEIISPFTKWINKSVDKSFKEIINQDGKN